MDLIRPDAKVTWFEVRVKKTLITLESKRTIAAGEWVFCSPPSFTQCLFFAASLPCSIGTQWASSFWPLHPLVQRAIATL
jgi:hypothetical protein